MGQVTRLLSTISDSSLKREVDLSVAPDIIYCRGEVFEVPYNALRNMGLDYRIEIETLVSGYMDAGEYTYLWEANSLAKGMYFYSLTVGGKQLVKKMIKN